MHLYLADVTALTEEETYRKALPLADGNGFLPYAFSKLLLHVGGEAYDGFVSLRLQIRLSGNYLDGGRLRSDVQMLFRMGEFLRFPDVEGDAP